MEDYNKLIGKKCYFIKNESRPSAYFVEEILDSLRLVEDTIKAIEIDKDGVFVLVEKWEERFDLRTIAFTPQQAYDKFKDFIGQIKKENIRMANWKYKSDLEALNKLIEKGGKTNANEER